jgi:hypothetical protein
MIILPALLRCQPAWTEYRIAYYPATLAPYTSSSANPVKVSTVSSAIKQVSAQALMPAGHW